ncbi:Hypothetical predicted protein [Olea europaea subsp. europaea]|uniref:Uncharacterized protein n=1 Tax=Olea europaea subsp. europaea TaxID=158383 RepID=A0A8S0RNN7_OLEEU|nr:Hypothetical predicted protein [Olea europaea subsp. europaea]
MVVGVCGDGWSNLQQKGRSFVRGYARPHAMLLRHSPYFSVFTGDDGELEKKGRLCIMALVMAVHLWVASSTFSMASSLVVEAVVMLQAVMVVLEVTQVVLRMFGDAGSSNDDDIEVWCVVVMRLLWWWVCNDVECSGYYDGGFARSAEAIGDVVVVPPCRSITANARSGTALPHAQHRFFYAKWFLDRAQQGTALPHAQHRFFCYAKWFLDRAQQGSVVATRFSDGFIS